MHLPSQPIFFLFSFVFYLEKKKTKREREWCTWPSTRNIMTDDSSTAAVACFSIIEGILATAASLEASGIPSMPMVVEIAKSSITLACDFDTVTTPPVSTTINSCSPQKDLPYKRSRVTPGSSTTIALFPYNL